MLLEPLKVEEKSFILLLGFRYYRIEVSVLFHIISRNVEFSISYAFENARFGKRKAIHSLSTLQTLLNRKPPYLLPILSTYTHTDTLQWCMWVFITVHQSINCVQYQHQPLWDFIKEYKYSDYHCV